MNNLSQKIIKPKLGLLELAKTLGNVAMECRTLGYSRDTFYRYKELYDQGGAEALVEISRRKPNLKNRVARHVEEAVLEIAVEHPQLGQLRVSNELAKKGIIVSPTGVRSVWVRNNLECFGKRLKALEEKVAAENIILNEYQIQALEKAKNRREARGEIESLFPGYLGSQDTYYVGHIKGIGRIYQQTFIDTYSRIGFAKLYTERTALTAADTLNDMVLPWFAEQGVPMLRILTDRGTEYCGKPENHAYELYLGIENIDHSKTKVRRPQTNGICERFNRTIKNEFHDVALRRKLYSSLEELQADLNQWLHEYNVLRPHSGKYCYGKTPMQTFLDSKHLAIEKFYGNVLEDESDSSTSSDVAA